MSLADKLRHHLADKDATWLDGAASWTEPAGAFVLVPIEGALCAEALVDAHLLARERNARLVVAHEGAPSEVAARTAARFRITLLDASALPEPAPARAAPPSQPFALPSPGLFRALERTPAELAEAADAFAALDALAAAPAPPPTPRPAPAPEIVVAQSAPEPEVAHEAPSMPWDLSLSAPEPEPVHVEAAELAAMPWNLHTEQHELLPAGRETRFAPQRPTAMAPDWGLPWPRPVAPTDGLAIADPRVWHQQQRIQAVRDDLDKIGAPSFGAVKPEGSAWLKRLSQFGGP